MSKIWRTHCPVLRFQVFTGAAAWKQLPLYPCTPGSSLLSPWWKGTFPRESPKPLNRGFSNLCQVDGIQDREKQSFTNPTPLSPCGSFSSPWFLKPHYLIWTSCLILVSLFVLQIHLSMVVRVSLCFSSIMWFFFPFTEFFLQRNLTNKQAAWMLEEHSKNEM